MRLRLAILFFSLLMVCLARAELRPVIYPVAADSKDNRDLYTVALVKLIFENSARFTLRPIHLQEEYDKLLSLLHRQQIDIAWAGVNAKNTDHFLPVNFPIMKGLIGHRLFLVHENKQNILEDIHTLDDLRSFTMGQGSKWAEVAMLRKAGLQVVTAEAYPALFRMLANGRFDLFPRSVLEISRELEAFSDHDLTIADHVSLHYDFALHFYTHKDNADLQLYMDIRLTDGNLQKEIDALFEQYYGAALIAYRQKNRRIIRLHNKDRTTGDEL